MPAVDWINDVVERIGGEKALKQAVSQGCDLGDLYWEESFVTSLSFEDGRMEKASAGLDTGASLRVVFDDHQAFGATNDLSPEKLMETAGIVASAVSRREPLVLSPRRLGRTGPAFRVGRPPELVDTRDKAALIVRAEKAARTFDPRIKQVKVVYGDRVQKVLILNTNGILSGDERTSLIFMVQVVAADGITMQVGYEPLGAASGFEIFERNPPEEVALKAARRAILMLEADLAPAGAMPVVLSSEAGGTMIHEAIGHGLEADLAGESLSVYAGRIGETVASPLITVIDDATLPNRRGSFAVDDEGTVAQSTVLVEDGVLKRYLYDRRTAFKAGAVSTGNGRRESYRHPPVVRMTNTMIKPGESDPAEILGATDSGLFVRKMGGGQVDTVNGDFVFEVSEGYLIRQGEIGEAVRGATLIGNGPEVLKQIDLVGSDLGFAIGTCGKDGQGVPVADAQPTLRIPRIVVGGRKA